MNTVDRPLVSIVMPYKNAAETLSQCLISILQQDMPRFELIAVNDNSTDRGESILNSAHDHRIRLLSNKGKGIVSALNAGIDYAQSNWIVRMDADDIMRTDRLSRKWQFINTYPDIKCIASKVTLFSNNDIGNGMQQYIQWQNTQLTHQQIVTGLLQESTLTHPSVMIEKATLQRVGGYREGDFPEDYDLWLRCAKVGIRFGKIDSTLLYWRDHATQLTHTDSRYSLAAFNRLRVPYLLSLNEIQSAKEIFVWGAGRVTRKRVNLAISMGLTINGWIDIDPRKIGQYISGLPVKEPNSIKPQDGQIILVYINSHGAKSKIDYFLNQKGFEYGKDYFHVG